MKILAVDDELVSRKKLQKILEASFECEAVDNGQEGLNIAMSKTPPDLILLDINLPEMDGFEVGKRLKANLNTKDIPIIFLTAQTDMESLTRGFELGAADYITKPFHKANVMARVRVHLSLKKTREELYSKNILLETQMSEIEKKTRELREKDQLLIEMDRMTGIGTFAAGMAHEINNPLNILSGNLFLLKRDVQAIVDIVGDFSNLKLPHNIQGELETLKDESDFSYLTKSLGEKFSTYQESLERIQFIVQELRDFSYIDTEELMYIDINKNIDNTLRLTPEKLRRGITVQREFGSLPEMHGNGRQINQVFSNIIVNALQAMEGGGVLAIKTSHDDECFHINFTDSGHGMAPEILRQAFNPFFTTRPPGSGTGIGLSIVEKSIKRHGGSIRITSEPSKGTVVSITIPIAESTQASF